MADLDKVKRNVAKMVSMNAPESDIDQYIGLEGVSLDELRNHKIGATQQQPIETGTFDANGNAIRNRIPQQNSLANNIQNAIENPFSTIAKRTLNIPFLNKAGEYADVLSYAPTQIVGGLNRMLSGGNVAEGASQVLKGTALMPFQTMPIPQMVSAGMKMVSDVSPNIAGKGMNAVFNPFTTIAGNGGTPITRSADNILQALVAGGAKKLPDMPESMYINSLKPRFTQKGGLEQMKRVAQTGLNEKVPISEYGFEKVKSLIDNLNNQINDVIQNGNSQGKTVDVNDIAKRLDGLKEQFTNQVNPNVDLGIIDNAKQEFLNHPKVVDGKLSVADAQAIKKGTYTRLNKKYGEQGSAEVEAQKQIARGIREELVNQFPELQQLNSREGGLIELQSALERRLAQLSKENKISLGSLAASNVAGLKGLIAHIVLQSPPIIKSRIAYTLNRAKNIQVPFRPFNVNINQENENNK